MKNGNLNDLHNTLCERLSAVADAVDGLFVAADEVAAIAETDPKLAGYLEALLPLMSLTVPTAPPSPSV